MPKIPTFQPSVSPPGSSGGVPMSPRLASQSWDALADAGEQASRVFGVLAERERKATLAVKADEGEIFLKDAVSKIAESYKLRTDFENFDKDLDEHLGAVNSRLNEMSGNDPDLTRAFNKAFGDHTTQLRKVVQDKKLAVITDRAQAANERIEANTLEDYVNTPDEGNRKIIRDQFAARTHQLAELGLMKYTDAEKKIIDFENKGKTRLADAEEGQIIAMGKDNPAGAIQAIDLGNFKNVKPDALERYRSSFVTKAESLETKKNQEAEKAFKEQRESAKAALGAGVMRGEDPTDQVLNLMDLGIFDLEDKKAVMADWEASKKKVAKEETENDPDALAEATDGVYRVNPTMTEGRLRQLWREGLLNDKTYKEYATHLSARIEGIRKEEKSEKQRLRNEQTSNGRKLLEEAFTLTAPGAVKYDPVEQYVKQMALPEFMQRVEKEPDANPFDIADEVKKKYRPIFQNANMTTASNMKKLLPFAAPEDDSRSLAVKLKGMKGTLAEKDYYSYAEIISDIKYREEIMRRNQQVAEEKKAKEAGKK